MQITVKEANGIPVWNSPDGKVSIYEIVDQDGNKWSTKSHKIGKGEGQTFEVEVENKNGKTYLRIPYDPNSSRYPAPAPAQQALPVQQSTTPSLAVDGFEAAVDKFSVTVDRLETILRNYYGGKDNPPDSVPTAEEIFDIKDDL